LTTMILASQPTATSAPQTNPQNFQAAGRSTRLPMCCIPPKGDSHRQHAMFLRVLFFIPDTLGSGERIPPKALRIGLRCHSCRYQIAKEQTANQLPNQQSLCGTT